MLRLKLFAERSGALSRGWQFAHVIYEMATGKPLEVAVPARLTSEVSPSVAQVLEAIFSPLRGTSSSAAGAGTVLSLGELTALPFFVGAVDSVIKGALTSPAVGPQRTAQKSDEMNEAAHVRDGVSGRRTPSTGHPTA